METTPAHKRNKRSIRRRERGSGREKNLPEKWNHLTVSCGNNRWTALQSVTGRARPAGRRFQIPLMSFDATGSVFKEPS